MPTKHFVAIVVLSVLITLTLTGCGKFNPPWGGSAW